MTLQRRRFCSLLAAAWSLGLAPARAQGTARYMADMHSHYGMHLPRLLGLDLAAHLKETGTTLLAWSITDDNRWIGEGPRGWRQVRQPRPGELWDNFRSRLQRYEAMLDKWGVPRALKPADIDAALAGEPRVLLATEAANFLEGDPARVAQAHAWGIRHMQLVHYIDSPLGDYQTAEPRHGGLSPVGREVIVQCNRHGIVVDLAHAAPSFVDAALDAMTAAPVWSHSWISTGAWTWDAPGYLARALPLAQARKIAARGGAMGLWSLKLRHDRDYRVHDVRTFADETMRMCDLVGPAHVAFGTDMEGTGPSPVLSDYADLREVANELARRGLSEDQLRGILIGNYARIVKGAMNGAAKESKT
jgi:membrane dipeptidase